MAEQKASQKHISFEDLSKIIVDTILDERYFDKQKLIPQIRIIISSFRHNINQSNYNQIESPSVSARRLRELEKLEFERMWWRRKLNNIVGDEKMKEYYKEYNNCEIEKGFKPPNQPTK